MNPSINEHVVLSAEAAAAQTAISRRRLLKAITAAGGTVAVSQFSPGKWIKPIVEVGVLPAHAQASLPATVSNLQKVFTGTNDCQVGDLTGSSNDLFFDYNDSNGNVTNGAVVLFSSDFQTTLPTAIDIFNAPEITVTGDAFQGTISVALCTNFGDNNAVTNQVQLRNARGDLSNTLSITVSRPPGAAETNVVGSESFR